MSQASPDRPEPRGCTLADLIALTFGAAIAASLHWYSGGVDMARIAGRPAPAWFVWVGTILELLQKSCVALTPVILQRRWRSGGPLRAVEYLPILTAFEQIAMSIVVWPVFGVFYKEPGLPGVTLVNMEARRAWQVGQILIGIAAASVVFSRWRRPRDWISGSLIALAWGRLTEVGTSYYQQCGNGIITSHGWPTLIVRLLSAVAVHGPIDLISCLPGAIALVDLGRHGTRRGSWVVLAATWLILPLPLFYQARFVMSSLLGPQPSAAGLAIHLGGFVITIGMAYLLARRFEPAWRWVLDGSPVEVSPRVAYSGNKT